MHLLLQVCPSFRKRWEERSHAYVKEPLLSLDLQLFAEHLVKLYVRRKSQEFPIVFKVIEDLIVHGTLKVRKVVTDSFLKDLQDICDEQKINNKKFLSFLGPKTLHNWKEVRDFWQSIK